MKSMWLENERKYDGTQLRSLFAYLEYGLMGDSIVAWQGPCDIPTEHMVDGEDVLAGAEIRGAKMLHFIIEKFNCELMGAVALQRLMASIAHDLLRVRGVEDLRRDGDDIYWGDKKLSISIATKSPVSALIHFAVNINNDDTPVSTASLGDFDIEAKEFANMVMDKFTSEVRGIVAATQKVMWVK